MVRRAVSLKHDWPTGQTEWRMTVHPPRHACGRRLVRRLDDGPQACLGGGPSNKRTGRQKQVKIFTVFWLYGHFGTGTHRHQDISAPVPKCLDTSALHWCRNVRWHFGTVYFSTKTLRHWQMLNLRRYDFLASVLSDLLLWTDIVHMWWFSPDSPKPDSPKLEKVHSMSKCSCFVEKKSYSVILSFATFLVCSITFYLFYDIRALRKKAQKVFARFKRAKVFARLKTRESLRTKNK